MKVLRALLFVLVVLVSAILAPFLWLSGRIAMGRGPLGAKRKPRPAKPVTDADLDRAERKLGFALPEALRAFYREGGQRRRHVCGQFYTLAEAVKEYRMLTASPYGPNGEDWPGTLFPFADLLHGYAAYDRDTGLVTEWDPDEIAGGNESRAAWKRAFQPTGKSFAAYLAG